MTDDDARFSPDAPEQAPGLPPQNQQTPQAQPPIPMQPQSQPRPQQMPMGLVDLTLQGSPFTSSIITPTVFINGYPVGAHYGRQQIPVPAGPVRVQVYAQWIRTYGEATLDFTLLAGQRVPVFYAAPWHQFTRGSIGFTHQKRRGTGFLVGTLTVVGLFLVLAIALAIFG